VPSGRAYDRDMPTCAGIACTDPWHMTARRCSTQSQISRSTSQTTDTRQPDEPRIPLHHCFSLKLTSLTTAASSTTRKNRHPQDCKNPCWGNPVYSSKQTWAV